MAKTGMPKNVKLPLELPGALAVSANGTHLVASERSHKGRLCHIDGATGATVC